MPVDLELTEIFDRMLGGFVLFLPIYDEKGEFISFSFGHVNRAFELELGLNLKDIRGKDVREVWPGTDSEWFEVYRDVSVNNADRTFEMYHSPTGRWFKVRAFPSGRGDGSFGVLFLNITENRNARLRVEHLNKVLRAVRGVNQLITTTFDPAPLIEKSCDLLVDSRGYDSAWIVLFNDDNNAHLFASTGIEDAAVLERFRESLKKGKLPECILESWRSEKPIVRSQKEKTADCPLRGSHPSDIILSSAIRYGRRVFGVLNISSPFDLTGIEEEIELFTEIAMDLGFALHSMEERGANLFLRDEILRIKGIIDNSPLITFNWQNKEAWPVEFVSRNVTDTFGYTKEEFENGSTSYARCIYPEDLPRVFREVSQNSVPGVQYFRHKPYRIISKNGRIKWVDDRTNIIRDKRGNITHYQGIILDISDRMAAEKDLEAQKEQFELAVWGTNDGIWDWDLRTGIIYFSPRWFQILGYEPFSMPANFETFEKMVHPDDVAELNEYLQEYLIGDRDKYEYEFRMRHRDGTYRWILTRGAAVRGENRKALRLVGSHSDITKRKNMEMELKRKSELLDQSQRIAKTGGWEYDSDNGQFITTAEFCRLLNIEQKRMVALSTLEGILPESEREKLSRFFRMLKHSKDRESFETYIEAGDDRRWLEFVGSREEEGHYIGAVRDVTERIILEDKVKQEKEMLGQILSAMEMGLILYDRNLEILWSNNWIKKTFPLTQLKGQKCFKAIQDNDSICRGCPVVEAFSTGKTTTQELYNKFIDRWLLCVAHPIADENGEITQVLESKLDITDMKKAEADREDLQQQLRQAQKLESIGMLAGGVAHDFNNLLTPIRGFSELLLSEIDTSSPFHSQITAIYKAAERAKVLTWQLLAFSRKQILDMKNISINKVIKDFQPILKRTIREDIKIDVILEEDIPEIRADEHQIEQIIMNLAINAQDAMPEGGRMTIETKTISLDSDYTNTHQGLAPGDYVMLSFSDTGHGMDRETLERIFEPFFTTKPKQKGTGLGLSTVFGIIKQHRGSIFAYSEKNMGTSFKVYLPMLKNLEGISRKDIADIRAKGNQELILIAEDDEMVLNLTALMLTRLGYKPITATSGDEILNHIREYGQEVALLITDVIMPHMNGRKLYEKAKEILPGLKVLYMSGYSDNVVAHHGILDKGVNYIQKPFSTEELHKRVIEAMG